MNRSRARFITFEGIEGVGKSTQVALASQWLDRAGIGHRVTREPGGTPLAEAIRELVLRRAEERMPPIAEMLLMFAARAVHLTNLVEPALAGGSWVLCDRFTDATYAYQGAGRGMDQADIATLERLVQRGREPDLTLLLDLPVETGLRRVAARCGNTDRFETERVDFFERVRAGYLQRARVAPDRIRIIDASTSVDTVHRQVVQALTALCGME